MGAITDITGSRNRGVEAAGATGAPPHGADVTHAPVPRAPGAAESPARRLASPRATQQHEPAQTASQRQ